MSTAACHIFAIISHITELFERSELWKLDKNVMVCFAVKSSSSACLDGVVAIGALGACLHRQSDASACVSLGIGHLALQCIVLVFLTQFHNMFNISQLWLCSIQAYGKSV